MAGQMCPPSYGDTDHRREICAVPGSDTHGLSVLHSTYYLPPCTLSTIGPNIQYLMVYRIQLKSVVAIHDN